MPDVELLIELGIGEGLALFEELTGRPAVVLQQTIEQIHVVSSSFRRMCRSALCHGRERRQIDACRGCARTHTYPVRKRTSLSAPSGHAASIPPVAPAQPGSRTKDGGR
jgi:hypothetical protein